MANLLDLPAELIGNLITYLDDHSIFATRLASKHLESSSLSYFGKRFFRKKGYLITTPSIAVLKSVAAHEELRKHVQHVWFNPDCYTHVEPKCSPQEDFDDLDEDGDPKERVELLSEEDRGKWERYREVMKDHAMLLSKPKLADELTTAFANLPNLVVIGMRRSEDHNPWGWSRLKDAIGEDPRDLGPIPSGPMFSLSGPTKLFIAIINAAACAKVEMKRLYTDAIEIDHILPTVLPQERLNEACRSLLYLEINASKARLNKRMGGNYSTLADEAEWGDGLLRLFKACPQLRELGLQIFPPAARDGPSWRKAYQYVVFHKLIYNTQLNQLTRLKLEKITTDPDRLKILLKGCRSSLTSLKLRDMRLLHTHQIKDRQTWRRVFEFLRDDCPKLSYLLLYHLLFEEGSLTFVKSSPLPAPGTDTANQPYDEAAGGDFFTKYEHIALEAKGRESVEGKLGEIVEGHWYHKPMCVSYAMDEGLWHTDTSDEEW